MKRAMGPQVASFFAFYCIVFIPFPFNLTKAQQPFTDLLFGELIGWISKNFVGRSLIDTRVYSDSLSMYILALLLLLLSVLTVVLLGRSRKWETYRERFVGFIYYLACFYLALQLLKYGLDKVFKHQFYLPEPNTLYTPIGRVDKDLLYWTTMGSSRIYSAFLGWMEVLAAILLLLRRTRLVGLLLSLGILLNIVAVNFGFDISVKLYSLFLLFLTFYLLTPYAKTLYAVFLQRQPVTVAVPPHFLKKSLWYMVLRWFAIGLLCAEAFYPYIQSKNFNDDLAQRPYLHGAYEVQQVIAGRDTIPLPYSPVKRFFIHRRGYIIFQDQQDAMQDYKLHFEKNGAAFILTDYRSRQSRLPFSYRPSDSLLILHYLVEGKTYQLEGKGLDWRKLPAVQKGFHWTSDEE